MRTRPHGILLDYGDTLIQDVAFDAQAGHAMLLARASVRPPDVTLEAIMDRAATVSAAVAARRETTHVETPWPTLTRLIYDFCGVHFVTPWAELELAFWQAAVTTRPMLGARDALEELHAAGVPLAVVSNCSFGPEVVRYELNKYGLADRLAFIMVSADYAVRKPHPCSLTRQQPSLASPPTSSGLSGTDSTPIWLAPEPLV